MRKLVARDVARLYQTAGPGIGPEEVRNRRGSLPSPVRRYLDFALSSSLPRLRTVHVRHGGWFRTKPDAQWMKIAGEEHFLIGEPGFVWNARVRVAPLVWIEARDLLLGGHGNMLVKLLSRITLADASGDYIDQGARLRWLAEAVWFPTAFAGPAVRWHEVDASSARAVLLGDGLPVELQIEVNPEGEVLRVRAERYRDLGHGQAALTPWQVRCSDYREFGGMRVPGAADVSWLLEGGEFACARFRVTAL